MYIQLKVPPILNFALMLSESELRRAWVVGVLLSFVSVWKYKHSRYCVIRNKRSTVKAIQISLFWPTVNLQEWFSIGDKIGAGIKMVWNTYCGCVVWCVTHEQNLQWISILYFFFVNTLVHKLHFSTLDEIT